MVRLGFDDALDRAAGRALGAIEVTHTLDARGGIDYVHAVAFSNRVRGASGFTRAAGDALFSNLHAHGSTLLILINSVRRTGVLAPLMLTELPINGHAAECG